ncbi:hypothetical protein [Streptomyces incarnatus]|nr:hypothetical protein [Streptomyces incarnatus]
MNSDERLLRGRVYGQDQQTWAALMGGPPDGLLWLLTRMRACRPRP